MVSALSPDDPPNLRGKSPAERIRLVAERSGVDAGELARAVERGGIGAQEADAMVENALGTFALPFGIAVNVRVNERDYLVPMAIEEPSVIAAASHAAKRVRAAGGFTATADPPVMVAQIEVHDVPDATAASARVLRARDELLALANRAASGVVERGGGARDVDVRDLGDGLLVTHVEIDCRDAMGANVVNTVAEAIGARVAELAGGVLGLRILSNWCDRRCTRVTARLPVEHLGSADVPGLEVARAIASASRFAERDPYRAATHNKGILNGVDAVAVATGNDWRAVEAGAHAHAARAGRYGALSSWLLDGTETVLEGRLEMPLALGIVGGALRAHAGARAALAVLGVKTASELGMVAAAVGLACNLAALRALGTEGIQRGHMALHRRAVR